MGVGEIFFHEFGDVEVCDLVGLSGDEDIGRFHVAVDDVSLVQHAQPAENLPRHLPDVLLLEPAQRLLFLLYHFLTVG